MGKLDLFRNFNSRTTNINIDNGSLLVGQGRYPFVNCLIASTKTAGRDSLLRELVVDSLNNNRAVFVIQNGTSLPNNALKNELSAGWGERKFFSMDFCGNGFSQPINFFKGSSTDFVQELLLILMASFKEISSDTRSFVERYLSEVLRLYRVAPQTKFSLNNILNFDRNWIISEATRLESLSLINAYTRDRAIQYANDLVLYRKEYNEYENFCMELQKQNFANLLSGVMSYAQLNTNQYVNFITLDYISCAKQSTAFLEVFIHKAIQQMRNATIDTTFVFEDIDVSTIPEFRELLKACQSRPGNNCYFTCDSIHEYSNLNYDPRNHCNSYFIFRQSVAQEADEWAKTSGTYKMDKATETTSTYDQVYGDRNRGLIGNIYTFLNRNKPVITGIHHEIVDEFNIPSIEFMQLPVMDSKVIINTPSGKPFIMQITWP